MSGQSEIGSRKKEERGKMKKGEKVKETPSVLPSFPPFPFERRFEVEDEMRGRKEGRRKEEGVRESE